MTITVTALAAATPQPSSHPFWCSQDKCIIGANDGGVVHRHFVGEVGDVQVYVERNDDRGPNLELRYGRPEVYVYGSGAAGLSGERMDDLFKLLGVANDFAAGVA